MARSFTIPVGAVVAMVTMVAVLAFAAVLLTGCSNGDADGAAAEARGGAAAKGWHALGEGTNNPVLALAPHPDGHLYAAGEFRQAGDVAATFVARWDGSAWSAVTDDETRTGMYVNALAVYDDGNGPALHAAISGDGLRLAKLTDDGWERRGEPINGHVMSLEVADLGSGSVLFAGGGIHSIGQQIVSNFAWWDGQAWSGPTVDEGTLNNSVFALAVMNEGGKDVVYAGGWFSTAGWDSASFIANWDGSAWSALGEGVDETIHALAVFDDGTGPALYAGGEFTTAGGQSARGIAKWDGQAWHPLADGVDGTVYAMAALNGTLYVGGRFTAADGAANNIAAWNGREWSPLGEGTSGEVRTLAAHGGELYVGGSFRQAGGKEAGNIARWTP